MEVGIGEKKMGKRDAVAEDWMGKWEMEKVDGGVEGEEETTEDEVEEGGIGEW